MPIAPEWLGRGRKAPETLSKGRLWGSGGGRGRLGVAAVCVCVWGGLCWKRSSFRFPVVTRRQERVPGFKPPLLPFFLPPSAFPPEAPPFPLVGIKTGTRRVRCENSAPLGRDRGGSLECSFSALILYGILL